MIVECVCLGAFGVLGALGAPQHPTPFVVLAGAVALWPAIRLTFSRGPVVGLLAAQSLLVWPLALERTYPPSRCIHGLLQTWDWSQLLVTFNALLLALAVVEALVRRALRREDVPAPDASQAAAPE
ncbi:MAG: hypothetical protein QM817_15225 [Archangium sp.]